MTKDRKIYGIDISKSVFDIYSKDKGHNQLTNDAKGFKQLLKSLPKTALVVMETRVIIITGWLSFYIKTVFRYQ